MKYSPESPDCVGDGLDVASADVQGRPPEQPHLCPRLQVPVIVVINIIIIIIIKI